MPETNKPLASAPWNKAIAEGDALAIMRMLKCVVGRHPLVRAQREAVTLAADYDRNDDIAQDLYVRLLEKDRFGHYVRERMSDMQIETEIHRIELQNMMLARFRLESPESYRLSRRVSTLVVTDKAFKRFDGTGHCGLSKRLFGLTEWETGRPATTLEAAELRTTEITPRPRDYRQVGCTGNTDVIILTRDLKKLVVEIFEAVDAPVSMRALRTLVLSKLDYRDVEAHPLVMPSPAGNDEDFFDIELVDMTLTPEEQLLKQERRRIAIAAERDFFAGLEGAVNHKRKQLALMYRILWHCFLSDETCTQAEIGEMLGVSDSLVSDYRKRIEAVLRTLPIEDIEDAIHFEAAVRQRAAVEMQF